MPPSLSSDLFRYLPQYWPQSEPRGGQGSLLIAPAPEHGPSLSPFPVMEKCPDQSRGGWERRGEEREVDGERKKEMAKDLGDVFKADMFERGWSRPQWSPGVEGGCW